MQPQPDADVHDDHDRGEPGPQGSPGRDGKDAPGPQPQPDPTPQPVGKIDRFGLDYETLRKTNPSVVYAWITGFAPADAPPRASIEMRATAYWWAKD